MTNKSEFRAEVSTVLSFGGSEFFLSGTLFLPEGEPKAVIVCWPGGSYDRRYWSFDAVPGYDFAAFATARGIAVLAADPLGVGGSSKPAEVDEVDFVAMSAAADEFVRQVRARVPAPRIVGVGHSLGGALVMATQATHGSYDRVASLGMTHGAKGFVNDVDGGSTPRQTAIDQARAILPDWESGYATGPRAPFHDVFYRPDVPAELIAADDVTAAAWPRQSYVDSLIAGYSAEFASRVECPVFLCFGDHDVHPRPHDEAGFYGKSNDVRTMVLANSGHCHNFAASRKILWDRLCAWSVETDQA